MFDICVNTISKGESGCIRCIDDRLMGAAISDEIAITSYDDDDVKIPTLDFFTHLLHNNICMKIFFPTEMMRGKIIEGNGFNREYEKIIILAGLKNFIDQYTPYASYEGKYGFKLVFKNGINIDDTVRVNEVYIILIKLCLNNHSPAFASSFNSKVFKMHMQSALNLLHSKGYCHKDLHIGNVVLCLDKKPQYKLIDFEHMSKCNQEDGKEECKMVEDILEKQVKTQSFMSLFHSRSKLGGRRKKITKKMAIKQKSKSKSKSKRVRQWKRTQPRCGEKINRWKKCGDNWHQEARWC